MGVSTQSTWGVKKANHGSCHSDSKKRSWRYLQIPHPSTQGKRQASQPRLRREEWFHGGSHQGDRPRLRPWRPTRQGPLPQHPQVQDGQGAHDRLRGHVHWHVRLQRSQSCSPHGNTTQLKRVPDGCVICNLEGKIGDRGTIAKCSGDYATVVAHDEDRKRVKVRLPSGTKKWFKEECRATIGIVAGGGRIDKPLLKAGRAF